jgi:hypothetical protein
MRALLLTTPILVGVLIASSLIARAEELAGPASAVRAGAPIVDVQPRADDFYPHSAPSDAEQEKLSVFDAKQQKLDEALDKKLDICRC